MIPNTLEGPECLSDELLDAKRDKLSVTRLLDVISTEFCGYYCRYPALYGENEDKLYEERCNKCPLQFI